MLHHMLRSGVRPSYSYITRVSSDVNGTSYTFNSTSIGAASSSRLVIVSAIHTRSATSGNPPSISSATINGVAATVVNLINSGPGTSICFFYGTVTSGTTANFVVNYNMTLTTTVLDVFSAYNLKSTAHIGSGTAFANSASITSATITSARNGIVIAGFGSATFAAGTNPTCTWSAPFLENADASQVERIRSSASCISTGTSTTASATSDNGTNTNVVISAISFE